MRIEADGVTIAHGTLSILRDVSLELRAGEFVGLIGPNGAGKTSLLHVLAALKPPRGGTVRFDGRAAADLGARVLGRRLSFLAQGSTVHWGLGVESVVALGRLPHRRPFAGPSAIDREAIHEAMRVTDTLSLRGRIVETLSGGERMRVLLARALAVRAEMLLADEPVAALDPRHALDIMALLRATAKAGCGVVVVLHDLALASRFCDRLILLAAGQCLADGVPTSVLTDAHLAAAYGVTAARGYHEGAPYLVPWAPAVPKPEIAP